MDENDLRFIRASIDVALKARSKGNHPFGALLVDEQGHKLLEAENMRSKFVLIAGGPRITNDLAIELGYDAGFGPGTTPSQVASFIVTSILERQGV